MIKSMISGTLIILLTEYIKMVNNFLNIREIKK